MSSGPVVFESIITQEVLKEAIDYLETNFGWQRNISYSLQKQLSSEETIVDVKGVLARSNQSIIGAILFFQQGYFENEIECKPIVNLSSWYVSERFRGVSVISLVRFMIDTLEGCIITNYSANEVATKILLAAGFKRMPLRRAATYLPQTLPYLSRIRVEEISRATIDMKHGIHVRLMQGNDIRFLRAYVGNQKVDFVVKKKFYTRSLFAKSFNMPVAFVIWTSSDKLVAENWSRIARKLMLYMQCIKLISDFERPVFPKSAYEPSNNYLIYERLSDSLAIKPLNSEFFVFD